MIGTALKVFSIAEDVYRQITDAGFRVASVDIRPEATSDSPIWAPPIVVHIGGAGELAEVAAVLGLVDRSWGACAVKEDGFGGNVEVYGLLPSPGYRIKLYTGAPSS